MSRRKRRPSAPHRIRPWGELHPSLDLHGQTADEARRQTERWLEQRAAEGIRTVRVITGRGRHSPGPPVLRGEIESLLQLLTDGVVVAFWSDASGGAFQIELRRVRDRQLPHPRTQPAEPSLRRADPALRARAEERLWELGITATPALLAAEIRRLERERDSA